ncbi:hypothetical protein [Candidatus Nitrosacidococcus tergens]|uniref:Cation/multidrug efflux pump n=1 Tax=Candidatus Nitrosacidococcus tergens TaxID=553981 RepID=A0A7G1Q8U6_9GAMM|nr:hypothetical protein [Candidatus Nitrosacidococcus tergens]CAB1275513.1 conserved exported protein of unknown function [Candidatus Nitrosacidococcus tergens]
MNNFLRKKLVYFLCLIFISSFFNVALASGIGRDEYDGEAAIDIDDPVDTESRNYFRKLGDLLIARPVLGVATALGSAAFVASLPFTAISGHVKGAANTLVKGPARATFARCLGCRTHKSEEEDYSEKNAPSRDYSSNLVAD